MQRPQLAFPYIGEEGSELAPGRRISLGAGPARLASGPDGLVLSWRGVEFTVSPALEGPLRRLVGGASATMAEISAAAARSSPQEVQDFVREMVRRGAFVLDGGEGS